MPQIGLRDLYYALLTKDDATGATYETPKKISGLINANLNPTINSGTLFADDAPSETASSLGGISLTIGTKDLPTEDEAALLGKSVDAQGVIVDNKDDNPPDVAIGFRSLAADGSYLYVWLLKGKFHPYQEQFQTKDNNINFQTPSITGDFVARAFDGFWRFKVKSGDAGVNASTITNWFNVVYGGGAPVAVTGISLVPSSANIAVGDVLQLTPNVSPANATNKAVTYTTSDPAIATVSPSGKVTGVAAGTATITVHTVDGAFTDTCAVTVA